MTEFKDRCFQDTAGNIPVTKDGDKVGLLLNAQVPTVNKLHFYTIVFSYGNEWQQHLTEDKKGRLCFTQGDRDRLKIYESYEQAKQVMDELSITSFSNEGVLQVCSILIDAVGEPSKGNPDSLAVVSYV